MTNRHKEVTAHIRNCLKREKIPARVRMFNSCGVEWIQVFVTAHDKFWTDEQRRMIAHIAKCNNLCYVRRMEIDVDLAAVLHGKQQFDFCYHADMDRAQHA